MTRIAQPSVSQQELVQAWENTLPLLLNPGDKCVVRPDERDPQALMVTIETEGRSMYSFDFRCTYVDDREVQVEFLDVERGGIHVAENTEIIQNLIEDYVRHFHECAQRLHALTHR
ncbi:hypothetical protein [Paenibacillus turpanensis]|uniref:hypothetical protein n=1 Tax=Paenibacillus turpanensis TaxID=2689078 RepID=UPI001407F721|nr:hypothetical protein [Paenibacillus turpanensis]